MINLFGGEGPLNREELKQLLENYEKLGKHDWVTELHLGDGDSVDPRIERLVNGSLKSMGNLAERLLMTLAELNNMEDHAQDCAIYLDSSVGHPINGICNCGHGLQRSREGDPSKMYSPQRITR